MNARVHDWVFGASESANTKQSMQAKAKVRTCPEKATLLAKRMSRVTPAVHSLGGVGGLGGRGGGDGGEGGGLFKFFSPSTCMCAR